MPRAEMLALPRAKWDGDYLEDISVRRLVLEFFDREHLPLRRYIAVIGLDRDTCQDVVQEAFLKLHEHLLAGGDRTNLRGWLYRVAHNMARNRQTAAHASKTEPLEGLARFADPSTGAEESPEQRLLRKERETALERAFGELSSAQRQCLALRAQGFKYREIGEVLQLSTSAVAENVQRGLTELRKTLL